MAHVRLLQKEEAQPKAREIYDKIEQSGARVLNLYRALAHNPDVLRNFTRLGNSLLAKAELSPKLRELVILRIAKLSGSEYEWAQHYPIALEVGVTHEQTEVGLIPPQPVPVGLTWIGQCVPERARDCVPQ